MKKILVYGDSNVWGGAATGRCAYDQQWPNILQNKLGVDYRVSQEGLSGRCAGGFKCINEPYYDGQYCFEPIYRSASPVDIVVLALGTNDLFDIYNRSADEIVNDILWYEDKVKTFIADDEASPSFIYVLPTNFDGIFVYNGETMTLDLDKRREVNSKLRQRVNNFVEIDDIDLLKDGLHFSPKGCEQMANAVYNKIMETK